MADKKQRSLAERLRELIENLREALSPRQIAPVPIPVHDDESIVIRRR